MPNYNTQTILSNNNNNNKGALFLKNQQSRLINTILEEKKY
jgi:hypothetical protein